MEMYEWSVNHLPSPIAALHANNMTCIILLTVVWWLIHVSGANKSQPYSRALAVGYAGFGLSVVGVLLAQNVPSLEMFLPTLQTGINLWLIYLFLINGLRVKRCTFKRDRLTDGSSETLTS